MSESDDNEMSKETLNDLKSRALTWAQTDCDLLDKAFGHLDSIGIKTFQHIPENPSSAIIEVRDAMALPENAECRACVWYHFQSTEAAVEYGELNLYYSPANMDIENDSDEEQEAMVAIGNEVAKVLQEHGLSVEYLGEWFDPVTVKMDWKRRYRAQ